MIYAGNSTDPVRDFFLATKIRSTNHSLPEGILLYTYNGITDFFPKNSSNFHQFPAENTYFFTKKKTIFLLKKFIKV